MEAQPATTPRKELTQPRDAYAFTVANACRLTGLGQTTIFALMRDEKLKRVKVGGRTLIAGDSIRALLGMEAA